MLLLNKCLVTTCKHNALSSFDQNGNLVEGQNYCLDHSPNPGKAKEEICKYIAEHDTIVGLNASGIFFQGLNVSGKKFYGCNFTHCTFSNVHLKDTILKICIFDFAVFNDCSFIQNYSEFSSFSGCTLTHTLFNSSDIIQDNFNGVKSFQSSFDDSDLFNSRFIQSTLVDTSFRNCNLKKTNFLKSEQTNVSFKMSNTREAIFHNEELEQEHNIKPYGNSIVDGGKL